jgi:membrane fusion protein (multidrug efflux system)
MADMNEQRSEALAQARPTQSGATQPEAKDGSPGAMADRPAPADHPVAPTSSSPPGTPPPAPENRTPAHPLRKWLVLAAVVAGLAVGAYFLVPWVITALNTVSTDDAYVNGHVTFVAPRVSGQVTKVLVDDNQRVKKGDLLVQLDSEPFQVQAALKRAAVDVAVGNLAAAEAQVRGLEALVRSQRWKIQTASEQVNNQVALLWARVATLRTKEATLDRARKDFERARRLTPSGAMSWEEFDQRQQDIRVAEASVNQTRSGRPSG